MLNPADYATERRPRKRAVDLSSFAHGDPANCKLAGRPALTPDEGLDLILSKFDAMVEAFESISPDEAAGIYFDCQQIAAEGERSPAMKAYAAAWMEIAESIALTGAVSRETVMRWFKAGQALTNKETDDRQ